MNITEPHNATATSQTELILPFRVQFTREELLDLRNRLAATRFPEKETVSDFSQGVPLSTITKLVDYWKSDYDLDHLQDKLNTYPQFITRIDGLDIHFIHVQSKDRNALPIIITHGWPGSIIWNLKVIGPLADPAQFGGDFRDAFHVVIPSLPGFGFSGKPASTGWNPERIAAAWIELMKRLGYRRFVAQGGDWGALVTEQIGLQAPDALLGIHTNMPAAVPHAIDHAASSALPAPVGLSPDERSAYNDLVFVYRHVFYAYLMATRPQTLTGFADSPAGLAAFVVDLEEKSLGMIARAFEGREEGLSRDDIIDNITVIWLTNSAISSARLYWENKLPYFTPKNVTVPVAVTVFPDELYQCPETWAKLAYPNLIYFNKVQRGGHFAPWEQPQVFVGEISAAFRRFRS